MTKLQELRQQYPAYAEVPDMELAERIRTRFYPDMDKIVVYDRLGLVERGAPAQIRALVGNARTPQDRLATIKQFFPDAEPYGDENFTYTNPETGKPVVYNPRGLDVGDVASVGRMGAEMAGGLAGGVAGTAAGPVGTVAGAALGSEAGGQIYDVAAQMLGQRETRPVSERLGEAASNVAMAGAGEVVGKGVSAAGKRIFGGSQAAREQAKSFEEMGVRGLAGDVTGSPFQQAVQTAASRIPGGAGRMRAAAQESLLSFEDAVNRTAAKYGPGGNIGQAIQQGGEGFVDRFKRGAKVFYNQVDSRIPATSPVDLQNTKSVVDEISGALASLPRTGGGLTPKLYADLAADIAQLQQKGGAADWQTISRLRTRIGERLTDPSVITDATRGDLKRLYASLSNDLEQAAGAIGPEALAAHRRAKNFYEQGINRIETVWQPLLRDGVTPERIAQMATSEGRIGGTKIRELRRGMKPEEWDIVASSTIQNLGKAADKPFDTMVFLRSWESMSPEAKTALFRGGKYGRFTDDLDRLAKIAGSMRETGQMANTSRTATTEAFIGPLLAAGSLAMGITMGAPVEAMKGAAAAAVAPAAMSYAGSLMSSPKFIRWLTTPVSPNGLAAHLGRLAGIAGQDTSLAEPIKAYMTDLARMGLENEVE